VKKILLFVLLAVAMVFMISAMPATAGPPGLFGYEPSMFVSNMIPVIREVQPAEMVGKLRAPNFVMGSFIKRVAEINTRYVSLAVVSATLAALVGLEFASVTAFANRLKYDARDRMHRLPRDQPSIA
jgi:hypothetical protein